MSSLRQALAKTQPTPATAPAKDGLLQRKPLSWQPPLIQTKLVVGQPDDEYEQEADRVADQVMRMPEPRLQRQMVPEGEDRDEEERVQPKPLATQITPLVQRQVEPEEEEEEDTLQAKPLAGQITPLVQRQEAEGEEEEEEEEPIQAKPLAAQITPLVQRQEGEGEEEEEEEEPIQAKPARGSTPHIGPGLAAQIRSLKGGGRPLSQAERGFFEPRFGYDFSRVRIHSNGRAAELSGALNARAFTHGRDIVLGSGRHDPGIDQGKRLLAHELAHVVQQSRKGESQAIALQTQLPKGRLTGIVSRRALINRRLRSQIWISNYVTDLMGLCWIEAHALDAATTYAEINRKYYEMERLRRKRRPVPNHLKREIRRLKRDLIQRGREVHSSASNLKATRLRNTLLLGRRTVGPGVYPLGRFQTFTRTEYGRWRNFKLVTSYRGGRFLRLVRGGALATTVESFFSGLAELVTDFRIYIRHFS